MSNKLRIIIGGVAASAVALSAIISLGTVATASAASFSGYTFSAPLKQGSSGQEVLELQQVLNSNPATQVSTTGAGSPGNETTYFGGLTKAAVIAFQNLYASSVLTPLGLTSGTGYVGAATLAELNAIAAGSPTTVTTTTAGCAAGAAFSSTTGQPCTTSTTTGTVTTSGNVTASLAADNTPARSIVLGQSSAELARFVFSGNGSVTNVTLQQTGLSAYNNTLNNVYLYNGGTRLTDSGSVSSNGVITFNNPAGLFTVSGSMEVTVRADLVPASQNSGQTGTVGVELTGFAVNSGTEATTALNGNLMTIINVTPAQVTFTQPISNPVAPGNTVSVNAGTTNYTIWSNTLGVSTRAVDLYDATFQIVGSAPASSFANIKLYVDGTQVGNAGTIQNISGSSYIVFDETSNPYVISTGSHDLEVRADIVGGASDNFTVAIRNPADLMLQDSQLAGVFVAPSTTTVGVAAIPGNTVEGTIDINQGSNSVTNDPNFTTTTLSSGSTNTTIASYVFTGYGENVKISSLNVLPQLTGSSLGNSLNNVSLYANGAQIGSTQNYNGNGTPLSFNLGSSLIIPVGQSVTVSVKADLINSTSSNPYTSGNLDVQLSSVTSGNAQGQSSQQLATIPAYGTYVQSPTLTIGGNSVTVSANSAYSNQTVAPNTAAFKVGSYTIQAGSSDSFRVTNLVVGVTSSAGLTN